MSPSADTRTEWSRRLCQALVAGGSASEDALGAMLQEAAVSGTSFVALLISRGTVDPAVVLGTLGQLAQLPVVDLNRDQPTAEAMQTLPIALAREYAAVGHRLQGEQLVVVFGEPPDTDDVRALSALLGYVVAPAIASPVAIGQVLEAAEAAEAASPTPEPGAAGTGVGDLPAVMATGSDDGVPLHIDDLLRYAVAIGASDLHLTTAMPACVRLHGAVQPVEGCPRLSNEEIRDMIFGILPQSQRERFEEEKELDTSHSIPEVGRFRVNVFMQRGTVAAVLRTIPHEIPTFESLSIPESIRSFTEMRRGLVLVTGPTGSGKSTTLASLVDIINRTKPLHIVTIEDPIEFLHNHKRSIVNQREVGQDTTSFSEALRRVLREDPDVILVGEMRDLETISMALTAAETGHLVFGTLHTQDAPQTIDRIVDVFPTNQQEQVRTMLAAALAGVVTQQLVLSAQGTGRLACCEVMMCTSAIRNLVRSNKTHQIYSLMQTGAQHGMQTMDQGLAKLVKEGRISEAVALDRCRNIDDLRNHLSA